MVPRPQRMVDELKIAGWGAPPVDLSLGEDEVHVWRSTVRASASEVKEILELLPKRERRMAEEADKPKVYAARQFMLRSLLGRYLDQDPGRVKLDEDPDGRPALGRRRPGQPHWDFACADTRAIFAISASRPLALHLEMVPKDFDVSALMEHVPPREAGLAEFLSPQNRARAVVGYHAEVQALRRLATYLGDPGSTPDAQIERLRLGKRFVAALAAEGWGWSPSFWAYDHLDAEDDGGDDE